MQLSRFHAASWLVWVVAGAVVVQVAPNPVLLLLTLAVSALVVAGCATPGPLGGAFPKLVALGAVFGLLRVALLAATTHGVGQIWFRLPELTLPRLLGGFTVGGTVEQEVVLQAAAESLQLVALLGVFGAFNSVVAHHELVGLLPRAYHEVGLVISVAFAFVPSTLTALHEVTQADRARSGGRPVRRRRTTRLLVPVLDRGLERAVALSESMDARGFGHLEPTSAERRASVIGLGSMVTVAAAGVALVGGRQTMALVFLVVGAAGITCAGVISTRGRRRTRHRPRAVQRSDRWMALGSSMAIVLVAGGSLAHAGHLTWGTADGFPEVSAIGLLAVLALATPAILAALQPVGIGSARHEATEQAPGSGAVRSALSMNVGDGQSRSGAGER